MKATKVINYGHNQAVIIPKQYWFNSKEVFINKVGEAVIITPAESLAAVFDSGASMLTDDFLLDVVPASILSKRDEL